MKNIDERFKDASPVDTVNRIRHLMQTNGFGVEEEWRESGIKNCFSVRVTIAGTKLSSFGKGVTKELARASGHAELMERLQSGYKGAGRMLMCLNDAKTMNRDEILAACLPYLEAMSQKVTESEGEAIKPEELVYAALHYGKLQETTAIPYLDVRRGEKVYLPQTLVHALYRSNGLAAGNSMEEAIVQGFSEIVERYCQSYFLRGKLTPPTIPDAYLANFPTAFRIIQDVRAAGLKVLIKDCSRSEGYPVIAAAIVDPATRRCRVIFGSSPVFEIALERSLTELFQGCSIDDLHLVPGYFVGAKRSANDMEAAYVSGRATYPIEFFADAPSYEFKPFEDRSHMTNKELLAYIMDYLAAKNRTMLIRDMSHLGFHTYRIIVPGMSELITYIFSGKPSIYGLVTATAESAKNLSEASIEELFAYLMRYKTDPTIGTATPDYKKLSNLPLMLSSSENRFMGLCSLAYAQWGTGNLAQAYRHALSAKAFVSEENKDLFDCLCMMIELRLNKHSSERCIQLLKVFFAEDVLKEAENCLKSKNPFGRFLIFCCKDCDRCAYAQSCYYPANLAVTRRMNEITANYDNEAAFARMKKCFEEISKK